MQNTQPTAQPPARQQHALDHLAIGQRHQQARRAVFCRVLGGQDRQQSQLFGHLRSGVTSELDTTRRSPCLN
jgi:hypothetical protein